MIDVSVKDPLSLVSAKVTAEGEQLVVASPYPARLDRSARPFRQYLTDNGTSTGSNDMSVDGSSTEVDFFISAHQSDDRYITSLSIAMGYGTTGGPFEWADSTSVLTNGCRLFYSTKNGEFDLHDAIKSNEDMFRLSNVAKVTDWEIRHIGASNDYGYYVNVDFRLYGLPYGIHLEPGTEQRLTLRIRDNAGSAADFMNFIAYGFDRF